MNKLTIIMLLILISNCGKTIQGKFVGETPVLNYYKDSRTNLCFVEIKQAEHKSHSHVPCESVSKFIK